MPQPDDESTFMSDWRTVGVAVVAGIASYSLFIVLGTYGQLTQHTGWLEIISSACVAGGVLWWYYPRHAFLVAIAFVPPMIVLLFIWELCVGWYIMGQRL